MTLVTVRSVSGLFPAAFLNGILIGLQTNYCIDATVKSAFERGYTVIIPEGTNTTFDNDYMTGETTVRYYNEDIWEELVESVSLEEALEMLERE